MECTDQCFSFNLARWFSNSGSFDPQEAFDKCLEVFLVVTTESVCWGVGEGGGG